MDGRRRYKGNNYNQEVPRATSFNRKPPVGNWRPTVPSWEKRFCTSVGKVPWRKILDAKKFMPDNVAKWNDSAGEEAFHNAKSRFYAKEHGLRCNLPMPDPSLYIDEIDWDCKIDPEQIMDLEHEPAVPGTDRKYENIVIFGDSLLQDQGFSSAGWGECEDELQGAANSSSVNNDNSWEHNYSQNNGAVEGNGRGNFGKNSWGWYDNNGAAMVGYVWGDGWRNSGRREGCNNSWGWYQYENNYVPAYVQDPNGVYGTWYVNDGNREGTGSYMSGYETSGFHGNDYERNHTRMNANSARKRVNFVSEQPTTDASRGNLTNSCAPVSHQASGRARNRWSMEKPVS